MASVPLQIVPHALSQPRPLSRKVQLQRRTAAVDAALEAWARWARAGLAGLGCPASTLLGRVIELGVCGAAQRGGVAIERDGLCEVIERAILRLAERERRVLVRHYLHWEPLAVSAQALGMSGALFRLTLHRARQRVADYLEGAESLRY